MINVGIAGIGFMGWIHWLAYQQSELARVTAIWSRDEKKRSGDWSDIQGNFGPPGTQVDLSSIDVHSEFEALLNDPAIDVVDLCLPPYMHLDAGLQAFEAGKHVFCEKPLAITVQDAEKLVDAAQRAKKQLVVGQVLPFFPEFRYVWQMAASGEYGRPLGGSFKRVISDPTWLVDFYDPEKTGGPMIDLHVHDAHFIRLLFGMPTSVFSAGRTRGEVVEHFYSIFQFADPALAVSATGGVIHQQGRPFMHGFEVHFENATAQFEFSGFADEPETMPLKVLKKDGSVLRPELGDGDPVLSFRSEIDEMASAIASGNDSKLLKGTFARDAIKLCHLQTKSVLDNCRVSVD